MILRWRRGRWLPAPLTLTAGLFLVLGLVALMPPPSTAASSGEASGETSGNPSDTADDQPASDDGAKADEDAPAQGTGAPFAISPPKVRRQLDPAILAVMRQRLKDQMAPPSAEADPDTPPEDAK